MKYDFAADISRFNEMYRLPAPSAPTLSGFDVVTRVEQFNRIIGKEMAEGKDIEHNISGPAPTIDVLVEMSDWFGDLCVYAVSEALRYGIVINAEHYDAREIKISMTRNQMLQHIVSFTNAYNASLLMYTEQLETAMTSNSEEAVIAALKNMLEVQTNYPLRFAAETFGLPMSSVLRIIMESNFSKLGADGLPIYDSDNKVQKGSNYWKPEPKIKEMLEAKLAEDEERRRNQHLAIENGEVDIDPDAPDAEPTQG